MVQLLMALTFVLALVTATDAAEEKNRFYVGIGISFHAEGDGNTLVVDGVLRTGPAERVGIKAGDIIKEIDGQDATRLTERAIRDLMQNGPEGSSVRLKIRRQYFQPVPQEFDTEVARERIDRVAWVSLNHTLTSSHEFDSSGGMRGRVDFAARVFEDKKNKKFVYWFRVQNRSRYTTMLEWDLLNIAIHPHALLGTKIPVIRYPFILKPQQAKVITLATEELPTFSMGAATVFQKMDAAFSQQARKIGLVLSPHGGWQTISISRASGYVPENRLRLGEEKDGEDGKN